MSSDPAAKRFFMMALARFAAMFVALFGVVITAGNSDFPVWLGFVLTMAGLAGFFLIPRQLSRRWRSPPE